MFDGDQVRRRLQKAVLRSYDLPDGDLVRELAAEAEELVLGRETLERELSRLRRALREARVQLADVEDEGEMAEAACG